MGNFLQQLIRHVFGEGGLFPLLAAPHLSARMSKTNAQLYISIPALNLQQPLLTSKKQHWEAKWATINSQREKTQEKLASTRHANNVCTVSATSAPSQ
jgi:hypothetical protein